MNQIGASVTKSVAILSAVFSLLLFCFTNRLCNIYKLENCLFAFHKMLYNFRVCTKRPEPVKLDLPLF